MRPTQERSLGSLPQSSIVRNWDSDLITSYNPETEKILKQCISLLSSRLKPEQVAPLSDFKACLDANNNSSGSKYFVPVITDKQTYQWLQDLSMRMV